MILSLDRGTKTGMYIEGAAEAYTIKLGKGDERFHNLGEHLDMLLCKRLRSEEPITKIIYEGAAHQKGMAMPLWHGLVGVLKSVAQAHGLPTESVHPLTMKKQFTGKGRWTKEECTLLAAENNIKIAKSALQKVPIMLQCDTYGIKYEDDNSADSYGVYWTYKHLKEK